MDRWPSGQWQQTVNLSAQAFAGSNPALSTIRFRFCFIKNESGYFHVMFLDASKIQNSFKV